MSAFKKIIQTTIEELCKAQQQFLFEYPKRENVKFYDISLDIEKNEDFAIWELEYQGKI